MPHTLQSSAFHPQPYQPVRNTAHIMLSTPRRVSLMVAGVFLITLVILLIANRHATSNQSALQPAGAHISGIASQSYNAATAPDTAATGTDPPPGKTTNNSTTHIEVNGQTIPVPANGSTSSTTTDGNSTTTVNVSNQSSQSSSGTSTSSTQNLNVNVHSSSHSSSSSSSSN